MFILISFTVLSTAFAAALDPRPAVHLPPIVHDIVKQAANDCLNDIGAGPEVAKRFFQLKFGEDEISKKFMYCISRKTNYGDEDGHLNDSLLTLFAGSDKRDGVQRVIADCNTIKKEIPLETMYEVIKCFHKNTPVLLLE